MGRCIIPQDFDKCVSDGGRVRTVKPNAKTYVHVCYKGGKSHSGEVKHVKGNWDAEKDPPVNDRCDLYKKCRG